MHKRLWNRWGGLLVIFLVIGGGLWWWQLRIPSITLPSRVLQVAISDDGTLSALLTDEGQIWLWPTSMAGAAEPVRFASGSFTNLALNANHTFLAAGNREGTVTLWDLSETNPPEVFSEVLGNEHRISQLAFSPDGTLLAIGGRSGRISLLNLSTKRLQRRISIPENYTVDLLVFSPDSQLLASAGSGQIAVSIWSVAHLAQLTTIDDTYPPEALTFSLNRSTDRVFSPKALAFSLDSTILTIFHGHDQIEAWELSSEQRLWRRTTLGSPTLGAFAHYGTTVIYNGSPNRSFFAGLPIIGGSDDSGLYMVRLEEWQLDHNHQQSSFYLDGELLYRHPPYVGALAITPDGRIIVSGDENGRVLRYEIP